MEAVEHRRDEGRHAEDQRHGEQRVLERMGLAVRGEEGTDGWCWVAMPVPWGTSCGRRRIVAPYTPDVYRLTVLGPPDFNRKPVCG